ncbi:hypothetical protein, partial [Corallococcus exiguus]|uniref:hypothetical protein n=1 Tax=Corallococcus exiguus TaxID=83462 RepID=UPI001B8C4050
MQRLAFKGTLVALTSGAALLLGGVEAVAQSRVWSNFQGAWLEETRDCHAVFVTTNNGHAFRRSINIFFPAFIISGDQIQTPLATCRFRSATTGRDSHRISFTLSCRTAVSAADRTATMSRTPDGFLIRYLNEED